MDTNVLFSGAYSQAGARKRLIDLAALGLVQPVITSVVLDELVRNLRRKAPAALARLERVFSAVSFEVALDASVEETERWSRAGLGSDAPMIAAAIGAGVDYFCTGDRRVLELAGAGNLGSLQVISPAELLRVLD